MVSRVATHSEKQIQYQVMALCVELAHCEFSLGTLVECQQ